MARLTDLIDGKRNKSPVTEAHFSEDQWIFPMGWQEGTNFLPQLAPRAVKTGREREWFMAISSTHGPGCVVPGNGPFFLPTWVVEMAEKESPGEGKALEELFKVNAIKLIEGIPVRMISGREAVLQAERVAEDWAWNMDPIIGRVAWYPMLSKWKGGALREPTILPARR